MKPPAFNVSFPGGHLFARLCVRTEIKRVPGKRKTFDQTDTIITIDKKAFANGSRFNVKECMKQRGFDIRKAILPPKPHGKSSASRQRAPSGA